MTRPLDPNGHTGHLMIWTAAQCRASLCTLENAPGPLTPRELHDFAGAELDRPSLATAYQNLSRLEERKS